MLNTDEKDLTQWQLLNNFHESYPQFNRGQLEWMYRNRETNGFSNAFCKVGRKRYVHAGKLSLCLASLTTAKG